MRASGASKLDISLILLRGRSVIGVNPRLEVLILGGLGTFLIFLNGVVYLVLGATFTAPIQFTTDAITVGLANILLTILLAALLWWYSDSPDPDDQGLSATLIVVVSAFTLWVGGGYDVGFVLAFTAGALGIVLAHLPPT